MYIVYFFFYLLFLSPSYFFFFFFNDTATTEIYTLSLHDALPISTIVPWPVFRSKRHRVMQRVALYTVVMAVDAGVDRKSTRLNSSHSQISYAVFCLKKKKKNSSIVIT